MDKQHARDLLEIKQTIESHIKRLATSGFPKEESDYRKQELTMLLNKVNKIRSARQKPIESLSTVRGVTFKIGDTFHIAGDTVSKYKIVLFLDNLTIRGEANNPAIGKPWTCEVYLESAHKIVKEKKTNRIKLEDKPKKLKQITLVKEGEYFAIKSNNTIYKAIKVKKGKVTGTNELKAKNVPLVIKTKMFGLTLKTKKDYKKQHKAEKNYKNK